MEGKSQKKKIRKEPGIRAQEPGKDNSSPDISYSALKEEPQTEHMEVHHHPRLDHSAKPWKEYVLEGLMIFLAVMMGFFAESYREHIADHERELQYMESLVHDLALDTIVFKAGFPIKEQRIAAIDSVYLFFETHPEPKAIPVSTYRNIHRSWYDRIYTRNTGTINQLKNAGGLRLIRKQDVRDSIVTYDQLWERLDYYKQVYYSLQQKGGEMIEKMLNATDLLKYYRVSSTGRDDYTLLPASAMIRIKTDGLNEYLNFLRRQKITTIQDEQNYKRLEGKAVFLIKLIKKEYDLE